jgi:hypothetical protein
MEHKGWGSPTSNVRMSCQDPHTLATPPSAQDPELQESMGKRLPSPPAQDQCSRTTRSFGRLLLLLMTRNSRTTRILGHLLLLLKTQSSRTSRGKGCLLLLKTQSSRTPQGKCYLLLLLKTLISILLQSN